MLALLLWQEQRHVLSCCLPLPTFSGSGLEFKQNRSTQQGFTLQTMNILSFIKIGFRVLGPEI